MNNKIISLINTTAGRLIFVLLSGAGYYSIIAKLLIDLAPKNALLLFLFFPLVICGAALILIKLIIQKQESDDNSSILKIFYLHIAVIIIGIIFAVSIFV